MLVEIPMLIIAPIGRLFSKLTPLKIVIGVLILVVAVVAYLLLRSNTVSGDLKLQVASGKGGVLGGAAVVIEPVQVAGAEQPTVTFTDVVTDVATKGKLEGKTSSAGLIQLKYAVTPGTRFTVRISAPEFIDHTDSIAIRSDSSIVLAYTLSPKPVAVPTAFALTVMVHDRAKNPIPAVNIRITGKSGKEYALTGDVRGMASLEYDPAVDGPTPEVSIAAPSLGPDYAQSTPKPQKVAGHQLLIDINTYFPYDQTLDKYVSQAEASIRNKDWDEARPPLLKAVQLRPGRGSGKAFTLLAQAWWEDNADNFKEALQAARSALLDEANVTGSDRDVIVEKMHFYETRAQYESWRDTKSAANKQATLAASERYLALVKGPRYASLVKTNNVIKDHLEEVQDINEAMK